KVLKQLAIKLAGRAENFDTSRFPLQGGFERGDMLIVQDVGSITEIAISEVIIFDVGQPTPLVRRVVDIRNKNRGVRLTTKEDGNSRILPMETSKKPEQIRSKVIFVIPELGYLSLWFRGADGIKWHD
ncbi:MAG: hypothetical protein QMD10_12335, partial [Desulfitobacteriaceae bacterium]|nr:hypothetical protein [Desulfitobacteriaceae bacterium]